MIQVIVKWANTNRRAFKEFGEAEYAQAQAPIAAHQVIKS